MPRNSQSFVPTMPRRAIGFGSGRGLPKIALALLGWLVCANAAYVQAQDKAADKPDEKTLTTNDNVDLKLSYYKSSAGKDAPVLILLHGKKGNRLMWKGFAKELQAKHDFAVITIDLRGNGESLLRKSDLKKSDYQAMAASDMEAVREFLLDEHQKGMLNINKQGIVACDFSAAVALVYAEIDWERTPFDDGTTPDQRTPRGQDIRALSLISPDMATPGLSATKSATTLRGYPMAVMVGASEKNSRDMAVSKKLFEQFTLKEKKIETKKEEPEKYYFNAYPEDLRGMDLVLQDVQVRRHIAGFMDTFVKKAPSEWRDRRSRLDRE